MCTPTWVGLFFLSYCTISFLATTEDSMLALFLVAVMSSDLSAFNGDGCCCTDLFLLCYSSKHLHPDLECGCDHGTSLWLCMALVRLELCFLIECFYATMHLQPSQDRNTDDDCHDKWRCKNCLSQLNGGVFAMLDTDDLHHIQADALHHLSPFTSRAQLWCYFLCEALVAAATGYTQGGALLVDGPFCKNICDVFWFSFSLPGGLP